MATRLYKIFALAGQSNAVGNNAGGAPTVVNAYQYYNATPVTARLSLDKSCAHRFSNIFYAGQTTHTPMVILRAASGVDVTTATAINWSASGTLRGLLKTDLDAAKTYLSKSDVDGMIWLLGEAGAELIRATTITRAQWKTAMQDFVDWWNTEYPTAPFYIVRTGFDTSLPNDPSWIAVQEVQQEICDENPSFVFMAYTGTSNFEALGYMEDTVHYSQVGQNVIGEAVANFIL